MAGSRQGPPRSGLPLRSGLRAPPPHPAHLPRACQRGRPGFSPRRPLTSETATRRRSIRPTRAPLKPPVRHGVRGCAHRTCAWLASARRRGLDRHPVRPSMLRYRVAASPCPTRGLMGDQLSDKPTPASRTKPDASGNSPRSQSGPPTHRGALVMNRSSVRFRQAAQQRPQRPRRGRFCCSWPVCRARAVHARSDVPFRSGAAVEQTLQAPACPRAHGEGRMIELRRRASCGRQRSCERSPG